MSGFASWLVAVTKDAMGEQKSSVPLVILVLLVIAGVAVYALWPQDEPPIAETATSSSVAAAKQTPRSLAPAAGTESFRPTAESKAPRDRRTKAAIAELRRQWQKRLEAVRQARERRLAQTANPAAEQPPSPKYMKYTRENIRAAMRELFPLLKECYENALLDAGTALEGKLVMRYTIAGEPSVGGIIEEAYIDEERSDKLQNNPSLAQCLTETIYTMEFEAPPEGGKVTVAYPIRFSRGDDDVDGAPPEAAATAASSSKAPLRDGGG